MKNQSPMDSGSALVAGSRQRARLCIRLSLAMHPLGRWETTDRLNTKTPFQVSLFSSGEWIRTTDLRVMSNAPESVPFVRGVLQISQTDERWFLLARHAAVVDRYSYSICFTWVRQVLFIDFLKQYFQFNFTKSTFEWGVHPP